MLLCKSEAELLLAILKKDGDMRVFPDICKELQEQIDGYHIDLGHILEKMHCEHYWGPDPTPQQVDRCCLLFKARPDLSEAERMEFTKMIACRCPKCGLEYRMKDVSVDALKTYFDESFRITVSFGRVGEDAAFQKAGSDYMQETKQKIAKLEKDWQKSNKQA